MKLARASLVSKKPTLVEDFYMELEIETVQMKFVKETINIWKLMIEKSWFDQLEFWEANISDSLKMNWGKDAFCLFDRDSKSVTCKHPDGKLKII